MANWDEESEVDKDNSVAYCSSLGYQRRLARTKRVEPIVTMLLDGQIEEVMGVLTVQNQAMHEINQKHQEYLNDIKNYLI